MKKDSSIQFLRLIGCLIVIGVHVPFSAIVNDKYDFCRTFIQCVLGDGVAIFWLITGCFLFRSSYKKIVVKTIKTIIVPIILFNLFFFYFNDYLFNGIAIGQSIHQSPEAYKRLFECLLYFSNYTNFSHLWYMYVYAFVMLLYPVLKSFVEYLDESNERKKVYFIISLVILLLNDISQNRMFGFTHSLIGAFFPAVNLIIYGHLLYNSNVFKAKKYIPIGGGSFLLINIIRAILQFNEYQMGTSNIHLLFWFTLMGLGCASSLLAFCVSLFSDGKSSTIINYLASHTFFIYIVHMPMLSLLNKYGILFYLNEKIISVSSNFIEVCLFITAVVCLTFILCLIMSIMASGVGRIFACQKLKRD